MPSSGERSWTCSEHVLHELGTLCRHDFLQRPAADRDPDAFLDDRRQTQLRRVFVRADRAVVLGRIDDPPVHEVVDDQVFLLARQEALARVLVVDQHSVRITSDVLEERDLEVQARLVICFNDAADPKLHDVLARIDGERGHANHDRSEHADDEQEIRTWVHAWVLGYRAVSRSRERGAALAGGGGSNARRRRWLGGRLRRAALDELVERQVQEVVAALGVDQDLRRRPQDLFERFDV